MAVNKSYTFDYPSVSLEEKHTPLTCLCEALEIERSLDHNYPTY